MEHNIACANCGVIILGASAGDDPCKRPSCVECGSQSRVIPLNVEESLALRQMLKTNQKRPGNSGYIKTIKSGDELFRSTNEWRKLIRVFDRLNDRYYEIITDPKTGEVVRECDEPLSQHIGRGTERTQPHSFPEMWVAVAAYHIWERAGRIHGNDSDHWMTAIEQLRRASTGVPPSSTAVI